MTRPVKLSVRDLHKRFGDFAAVKGLSFDLEEGETLALLGPSGCGKSTTLNMIIGLEKPSQGDIEIDGRSVVGLPPGSRNIGLVFQDYAVFTHMTVRQNIAYGLTIRRVSAVEIAVNIAKIAELVGLSDDLDRPVPELGGSQLQRVALARTLVTNPSILLLDEPLSNLEAEMRTQMRRELRRIQAETKQTIIYVTHDQIEALSLAHRIAVMRDGELQQAGESFEVFHFPQRKFVGGFLGNPPMNFLHGNISKNSGENSVTVDTARIPLADDAVHHHLHDDQPVTVGFRAESANLLINKADDSIPAEIFAIEPQGPEQQLTTCVGDEILKLTVKSDFTGEVGDMIWIQPHPKFLALFDPVSGVRFD